MAIFRTVKSRNYSTLHNGFLVDNSISLKAKGLLAYFLSRPDDWKFYSSEIVRNCTDGATSVSSAIKELMKAGYIQRFKNRDEKGRYYGGFDYFVYELPIGILGENFGEESINNPNGEISRQEKPNQDIAVSEKLSQENPRLLSTDYKLSTEYILNTKAKENTDIERNTDTTTPPPPNNRVSNSNSGLKGKNEDIYNFFKDAGFGLLNSITKELIDKNIEEYSSDAVRAAMVEAIKNNKCKLSYVEGVLRKNKSQEISGRGKVNGVGGTIYQVEGYFEDN